MPLAPVESLCTDSTTYSIRGFPTFHLHAIETLRRTLLRPVFDFDTESLKINHLCLEMVVLASTFCPGQTVSTITLTVLGICVEI